MIDTNVFVSAAIRTGPSHRVVQAWLQRNAFGVVVSHTLMAGTTRDVDEDYFVAIARQYDVDYIVSGDKDLLAWLDQQPPVISPAEFEQIIST